MKASRSFLLFFALGAITVFAYAPFGWAPLLPLALLPLFLNWREATPRGALGAGFAWGLGHFFAGIGWLIVALNRFGGMPLPLAALAILLFAAYLALFPALAGYVFARLRTQRWWRDALLAAAAWSAAELLRGYLFTGFPWLAIGYTQTPPWPLAGYAPVLGVFGMGFVLALMTALVAFALPQGKLALVRATGVVILLGALGFGLRWVPWTHPQGEPVSVALAQLNVPQDLKWDPERMRQWLELNLATVRDSRARITVLPETSLPTLAEYLPEGYLAAMTAPVRTQSREAIVGIFTRDADGSVHNSAMSLGTTAGQVYSKDHLVPFGEYSPPLFGWFYKLAAIPMADQARGGRHQALMHLAGQSIALNICYEDLFGEELIRWLPEAGWMLNVSNLAWYGDSHAQPQHLQIARLRAMETGRPMLRSTNTGMTALIAPDGAVQALLPPFTRGVLEVSVRSYVGMTPYAHTGNWPVVAASVLILALAARSRRKRA
ncbi:apolipoprotein N-acyltransferase [Niveibacterium sp. SC-1]|uniref:apolipoprotein N-acyltransferase n=1 Tax=Niveibacterium sp. SC-1 TaxID=3135646 RepID=UPI00311E6AE6